MSHLPFESSLSAQMSCTSLYESVQVHIANINNKKGMMKIERSIEGFREFLSYTSHQKIPINNISSFFG